MGAPEERKGGAPSKSSSARLRPSPARALSAKSVEQDRQRPQTTVVRSREGALRGGGPASSDAPRGRAGRA